MKVKTSYSTIKKAFILVDDMDMYMLFGEEDEEVTEFNKFHTMKDYIESWIEDTNPTKEQIENARKLLKFLNKELENNDIVQFLLVSEKQTENGIEV